MNNTSEVRKQTLPNGLQIIGERNPNNKSASLGFFVKTGARDETEPESGISHFLEHMMFKGTAKRSALEVTFHLGNIGAQANAFTSEENTVYYASVVPKYFSAIQELLSDMLRPALDQHEFDTEKKVILEEIALYQDRPNFYLFEHASRDFYAGHPAGNSVLGSTQSVSAISRDLMRNYFERRYAANNISLVASGNFDWNQFLDDANRYCGAWKSHEAGRAVSGFKAKALQKEYRKKKIQQSHVLFMTDSASAQEQERYPLGVLANILGDSSGSKLYWELIDSGLADSAGADSDERDGTGCFMVYASTEPAKLEQVASKIKNIISDHTNFSEQDLERAKTKICSRVALSGELPFSRLLALGTDWTYLKQINSLKETIAKIKAVTRAEIEKALAKFPLKTWSEFRLLPE